MNHVALDNIQKLAKLDDLSAVYEATFQARAKWKQMLLALQVNNTVESLYINGHLWGTMFWPLYRGGLC